MQPFISKIINGKAIGMTNMDNENQKEIDQKALEVLQGNLHGQVPEKAECAHELVSCSSVQLHIGNYESCTNKLASDKDK